jgi:hypothetical protein
MVYFYNGRRLTMKWSHKVIGTAVGFLVLAATGMQPVMADGSLDRIKETRICENGSESGIALR